MNEGITKEWLQEQILKLSDLAAAANLKRIEAESYYLRAKQDFSKAKDELECHLAVKAELERELKSMINEEQEEKDGN